MTTEVGSRSRLRASARPTDLLSLDRPDWMAQAACVGVEPETFYPINVDDTVSAKRVCRRCPVLDLCLRAALDRHETHGVWGGLGPRERAALQHGRRPRSPNSVAAERHERVRQLAARGLKDSDIAAAMSLTRSAVEGIRKRCGIEAGLKLTRSSITEREAKGHGKRTA